MPPQPDSGMGGPAPDAPVPDGAGWIADLVFSPPPAVNQGLQMVTLVAAVVVAYRVYQWGGVPLDAQREMQIIIAHIVAITTASLAAVNVLSLPYHYDVLAGVLVGSGTVFALQTQIVQRSLPVSSGREAVAAGWFTLAVGAMVLPMVAAATGNVGVQLVKVRFALALLATGLLVYNARILTDNQSDTDDATAT